MRAVTQARDMTCEYAYTGTAPPKWSPDGRTLYAPGASGVYGQLLRISVAGGAPQPVFESRGAYNAVDLSPDGATLAFAFNNAKAPNDIWIASASGRDAQQLTFFNPQVKEFTLADTEVIKWAAPDGLEIEGM